MRVLIGGPESGKTTLTLHYVYNEVSRLLEGQETPESAKSSMTKPGTVAQQGVAHACIITSKKKLIDSKMIFGIYCEVSIDTLREVKLKYIEDYEDLVQFLSDFHLLPVKPSILAIDSLEYFVDNKRAGTNQLTKQIRFNFLMSLIKNCQNFMDKRVFRADNLIVSYKITSHQIEQKGKADLTKQQQQELYQTEFHRLYSEITRYTSHVFYNSRVGFTDFMDGSLLDEGQREELQGRYIDIFRVVPNPFYLDDMLSKINLGKRSAPDDYMQSNQCSRPMEFRLVSVSKESEEDGKKFVKEDFSQILTKIREYREMED